jgi:hypothetical protein
VFYDYKKGYILGFWLLRPPLFRVYKRPKTNGKKNDGGEVENESGDD